MITIAGIGYRVVESCMEDDLFGEIDFKNQVIRIDRNMGTERKNQTLMHEIIHAAMHELGYEELNKDEKIVQGLSAALYHLFKDNKTIFPFS